MRIARRLVATLTVALMLVPMQYANDPANPRVKSRKNECANRTAAPCVSTKPKQTGRRPSPLPAASSRQMPAGDGIGDHLKKYAVFVSLSPQNPTQPLTTSAKKSSYMPVVETESFTVTRDRMSAAKATVMKRQMDLLEERYDFSDRPAEGLVW